MAAAVSFRVSRLAQASQATVWASNGLWNLQEREMGICVCACVRERASTSMCT
jgi:hypothetical protein